MLCLYCVRSLFYVSPSFIETWLTVSRTETDYFTVGVGDFQWSVLSLDVSVFVCVL